MRTAGYAIALVAALAANSAQAACSGAQPPTCAVEGAFASAAQQDQCRRQMLSYKSAMEDFAQCLHGEGQDQNLALAELERVLAEFNRRSRELPSSEP